VLADTCSAHEAYPEYDALLNLAVRANSVQSGSAPIIQLQFKRVLDVALSALAILALAPVLLAISIAIKLDSSGPILYTSERVGKKARVFRYIKFRAMVREAEHYKATMMHMNECDGVLFKMANDPRITRLGRFLRRYSLHKLPQFFNVLLGDMSIFDNRPLLASEVLEHGLGQLDHPEETPAISPSQTQAHQNQSF
jgi:lipopolysaccharide/colanic/teichoic acid biosynthesis glycosyltransferase